MKYLLYICLFISLLLLNACSDDSESSEKGHVQQKSASEVKQNNVETEKNDDDDNNMFAEGLYENVKGKTDIGTYESGPVSITIDSVSVKRGEIYEEFLQGLLPKGEVEFVRVVMTITSNRDNIIFDEKNFRLTTDLGEEFKEPNALMSSFIDIGYRGAGEYNLQATYLLEKSTADKMKKVIFYVKAPSDENGEPLGKDISVDINLSE